jgi:hypothetical protein
MLMPVFLFTRPVLLTGPQHRRSLRLDEVLTGDSGHAGNKGGEKEMVANESRLE